MRENSKNLEILRSENNRNWDILIFYDYFKGFGYCNMSEYQNTPLPLLTAFLEPLNASSFLPHSISYKKYITERTGKYSSFSSRTPFALLQLRNGILDYSKETEL